MALLKLIFIFILLLFLLRRRWMLGHALFLAAILCGLMQEVSPFQIGISFGHALKNIHNLLLSCIIVSILIFAHSLGKTGYAERLIQAYQGVFPWPRFNLMMLPALIGLLPMPGGAIFSAPLVEGLAQPLKVPRPQQAMINYWFRHTWEYAWPLYPGLILTTHLGEVDLFQLIALQLPFTILAFGLGYVFLLRSVRADYVEKKGSFLIFFREIAPILTVVVLAVGGEALFHFLPREVIIGLAVWVGISWVWMKQKISFVQIKEIFKDKTLLKVLYAVVAIFCFKQMLNESRIVFAASDFLTAYHVPLGLIAAFLPFLVGLIIGLTLAFVGTTFPLIFALIQAVHAPVLPYIMLAFACGVVGVLLSPMHLCFVLSIEYFKAEFKDAHQQLYLPCFLCWQVLYFGFG
ncbi:MAG: DUF401 family protein [Candidatus Desulfofervidaceae bacterium]|nr:DUF401 family protein [Candidatus Desulfofervidaceae bacterium]